MNHSELTIRAIHSIFDLKDIANYLGSPGRAMKCFWIGRVLRAVLSTRQKRNFRQWLRRHNVSEQMEIHDTATNRDISQAA